LSIKAYNAFITIALATFIGLSGLLAWQTSQWMTEPQWIPSQYDGLLVLRVPIERGGAVSPLTLMKVAVGHWVGWVWWMKTLFVVGGLCFVGYLHLQALRLSYVVLGRMGLRVDDGESKTRQ